MRILIVLFLTFAVLPLSAQWSDWVAPASASTVQNPNAADEASLAEGKALFSTICYVCHGNKGKGDGINAPSLAKPPADLTSGRVQRQNDGILFYKISEGRPPMLSFKGSLTESQRWNVINYVRELAKLYPPPAEVVVEEEPPLAEKKAEESDILPLAKLTPKREKHESAPIMKKVANEQQPKAYRQYVEVSSDKLTQIGIALIAVFMLLSLAAFHIAGAGSMKS